MASRSHFLSALGLMAACVAPSQAQGANPKPKPKAAPQTAPRPLTDTEKLHYLAGFDIGQKLRGSFPNLDVKAFAQGVEDALQGKPSPISPEETKALYAAYQKGRQEEAARRAEANLKEGQAFLAANQGKEGVLTLPTGVQYRILTAGEGEQPTSADKVVVHFRGTLLNGKEFDSSFRHGEPGTFPIKGVLPAWQQVLPLMAVGSKWQVFVPADQAYGPRGAGPNIGPNETLIFEIELLKILREK
jgi:FKBP-type peptidyl-prolyl cis-trans isomerase FklB